ncbi:oligosaccharide flippase family protein [Kosakonia sp. H02]|nr:oligosaccharide flippase family protein [Kosakonia sp. H02]
MSRYQYIMKSVFFRNVFTLMFGTSIAQLIPILISPVLTRAYTPTEFGVFATFTTLATIIGTIATGRYELAITLPRNLTKALSIVIFSFSITIFVSLLWLFFFLYFRLEVAQSIKNELVAPWLTWVPIFAFFYAGYQIINYWHNRQARFKVLAISRVFQSIITGTVQLLAGILQFGIGGLVAGVVIGQMFSFIWLLAKAKQDWSSLIGYVSMRRVLFQGREYVNFPLIDGPTSLLNVFSSQLPNILFAILFSPSYAGFYFLTQRVLQAPVTLISGAFLDVFKQKASEEFSRFGHAKNIYKKTFVALFSISTIPAIIGFIFLPVLFKFFFGKSWYEAGVFGQILIPAIYMRFVVSPLSFIIYIAQKQKWNLICMILLCCGVTFSLLYGANATDAVVGISASYVIYYIMHLMISMKLAGFFTKKYR